MYMYLEGCTYKKVFCILYEWCILKWDRSIV